MSGGKSYHISRDVKPIPLFHLQRATSAVEVVQTMFMKVLSLSMLLLIHYTIGFVNMFMHSTCILGTKRCLVVWVRKLIRK